MNQKSKQGYMLVELIVAISLLVVGFLGFLGLLSRALSLNRVVADQFIANYLAMEGIEITKNLIDSNIIQKQPWNKGFDSEKCYKFYYLTTEVSSAEESDCDPYGNPRLKYDDSTNFYGYASGIDTPFFRAIRIVPDGTDKIKVVSIVKWKSRGSIENKIDLEDHFYDWRPPQKI